MLIFSISLGSCWISDGIRDSSARRMAVELGVRSEELGVKKVDVKDGSGMGSLFVQTYF